MTETVFVHAMLATPAAWRGVHAHLDGPDPGPSVRLPGHDGAPPPHEGRDYLASTVRSIGDVVGPGPAHLVGHSFGAVASLAHALEAPGTVGRLTLIEPVLFAAAPGVDAGEDAFAEALARGDHEAAARGFHGSWGHGDWDALPMKVRAHIVGHMKWVAASRPGLHDDSQGILAPGRLEALDVPVTLVGGTRSPPVTAAILDVLEARLPDARRVRIEGAGHMAPMTHPAEAAAALRR